MGLLTAALKNLIAERALRYFNVTAFERKNAFDLFVDMTHRGAISADDHARTRINEQCADLYLPSRRLKNFWKAVKREAGKREQSCASQQNRTPPA